MAKYTITYLSYPPAESNDSVLTLVNQAPSPLPTSGNWTAFKHDAKTVMEISTEDADATLVITPPSGTTLSDQNVKAKLGMASGNVTTWVWKSSTSGLRLEMNGAASNTTFELTDAHLPPQALKVVVKRPV